jgi:N-succinyldiaminopimelate aminotransferase
MTNEVATRGARRTANFSTTIFTELTELANRTGAVNLGQGFPDSDGPRTMIDRARHALVAGENQYPPLMGVTNLREAIARQRAKHYGTSYDAATEIVVTAGATEAVTAAVLALCEPGDEIIVFDPCYDLYRAAGDLAGAVCRRVPLRRRGRGFGFDPEELRRAVSPRSRLLLLNTPHNPTGKVFTRGELDEIAEVCRLNDLVAVVDEVYEYLVYEGATHVPLASLPAMRERTLTVSSAGKTFSVTGWKVGWACGPAPLIRAVTSVKQYLTFAGAAPLQEAVAMALDHAEAWVQRYHRGLRDGRDLLAAGLREAGLDVIDAEGGYFVQASVLPVGTTDATAFCRDLPFRCGVVAIPTAAFADTPGEYGGLVRFTFCKDRSRLERAVQALASLRHVTTVPMPARSVHDQ